MILAVNPIARSGVIRLWTLGTETEILSTLSLQNEIPRYDQVFSTVCSEVLPAINL